MLFKNNLDFLKESYNSLKKIPDVFIKKELYGLYGERVTKDLSNIINLYDIYENGADFKSSNSSNDAVTPDLKTLKIKSLIDKEARFMTAKPPELTVKVLDEENKEVEKTKQDFLQKVLDIILKDNFFSSQLNQSSKDCLIGKRVACILNFNEETGVSVDFIPSLSFIYEYGKDSKLLDKIVVFYEIEDEDLKGKQRYYKKKYWMEEDGFCWVNEGIYDAMGNPIEEIVPDQQTLLNFIPAVVILNKGLLGDEDGESEVVSLSKRESYLSRLNCKDISALEKSMNPTRYTINASAESTKNLSIAPASFWDLQNSEDLENGSCSTGILESSMNYSTALETTFKRINSSMHEAIDVPDVNLETMSGTITSGKGLKAIYWGLMVRIDEKMLYWLPTLSNVAKMILKGVKAYPNCLAYHEIEGIVPDCNFEVNVVNCYPIPEDEEAEKQIDAIEVNSGIMSRKRYLKKWHGLTDEEVEEELEQIAREKNMLESYNSDIPYGLEEDGEGEGNNVEE